VTQGLAWLLISASTPKREASYRHAISRRRPE
jgi:hypothetical protein